MPSNGTGKRLFVMVAGMRDWNGSIRLNRYNQFNNMKVGNTTLTEVAEGHSDYNSSAIGVGFGNETGTQTLQYNINVNIGGGAGYTYLFVLDYVSDYIWTNYTYNTRSSSYSISPNTTVTYDSSYAGKKNFYFFVEIPVTHLQIGTGVLTMVEDILDWADLIMVQQNGILATITLVSTVLLVLIMQ